MPLADDLDAALADAENQVVVAYAGATAWGNRVLDVVALFAGQGPIPGELTGDELVLVRLEALPGLAPQVEVTVDGAARKVTRLTPGPDATGAMVILSLETLP